MTIVMCDDCNETDMNEVMLPSQSSWLNVHSLNRVDERVLFSLAGEVSVER